LVLPVLHNAILTKWNYLRTNTEDCYVCDLPKDFTFYTSLGANYFNIIENSNNIAVTTTPIDDYSLTVTVTNLNSGNIEGSSGNFTLGYSGNEFDNVTQPLWVGLPQAVPDQTVNGQMEVGLAGQIVDHKIDDGFLRLNGIDTYNWDFPVPNESYVYFGGPGPNNSTIWEFSYFSKYIPRADNSSAGNDTGIVTVRGENPCGIGSNGLENELCVYNLDDNDGEPDCSTPPQPIYYYPNPAGSLLEVDLSLQPYKIFDVYIYDEYQTVRYYDQSTNVIKTVDTFNLINGFYYLHIYDGSNLILSAILIINH